MEVDLNLISRCKKYDKSALMELFKMYEKYLYRLCYTYSQNQQDALDLVQEIYIKVFKNINQYNEAMAFNPWIRKIAVNTCLNFKRSIKGNILSLNYKYENDSLLEDMLAADYDIEEEFQNKDLKRLIEENLKNMPENYRLIIMLRYYDDLSYSDISELLNKPLGTVKTELYRAKLLLKKQLERVWEV